MADANEATLRTLEFTDPFHGAVWLSASRPSSVAMVTLIVSIERSWDTEILLSRDSADALADSIGRPDVGIITGETVDGAVAVLVATGDRLAITILEDRLSDVLILGSEAGGLRDLLHAAAAE